MPDRSTLQWHTDSGVVEQALAFDFPASEDWTRDTVASLGGRQDDMLNLIGKIGWI
jgi:hypothetical protein